MIAGVGDQRWVVILQISKAVFDKILKGEGIATEEVSEGAAVNEGKFVLNI
jgi:hypothetical protein